MTEITDNTKYTQFELSKEFLTNLRSLINEDNQKEIKKIIEELHAADIAEILNELNSEEAKAVYMNLDHEKAADSLAELEDDVRDKFLKILPSDFIAERFIKNLESDDAADIIGDLPEDKKAEVLSNIDDIEQADDIIDLLAYDEDTAGGLMAKELIAVNKNLTVRRCLIELREQAKDVKEVYYIYVVDDKNKLIGTLSLKKLLLASTNQIVNDICNTDVISAKTSEDSEEVAQTMKKYDLIALPVVDEIGRLTGRITIDDIVDVITEEAEKDYQMISGLTVDVESSDSIIKLTKARFPWLLIGLFGGILGAGIIGFFEGDITKYAGLALFLPLIAAMGGNAGVQSSSIVVQSLAASNSNLDSIGKKLLKELGVALINAIILSSLIFLYTYFFNGSIHLTLSVSLALFTVIIFASIFGTFVPLILDKLKIDPALATGPFITTVNDIMGLLIYLVIGRMIFLYF
jgi:magnesium transporter